MRSLVVAALSLTALVGAQQLRLTTGSGGGERQPVVSADGSTVAYVAIVAGVREVFTVPVDGGTSVQRTNGAAVRVGNGVFDAWPSLSISDEGSRIAYWNAAGVHVLDTVANSDTIVAAANAIPYPQIDASGQWVVYQSPIGGQQEVFLVPAGGGTAQQITTASGAGRRLPDVHVDTGGVKILFQKQISGFLEVFVHDVTAATTTALTSGSGPGNRYARFAHAGGTFTYDSTASGSKEVWIGDIAGGAPTSLTSVGKPGDRLAVLTSDDQAFLQSPSTSLEVLRVNDDGTNLVVLSANSTGGLRRVSSDLHGHVFVYQSGNSGGSLEVFQHRLCAEATFTDYGVDGQPSVGQLQGSRDWYRCDVSFRIDTSLSGNSAALFIAAQPLLPGFPLPGAPGNFFYLQGSVLSLPLTLGAGGEGAKTFPIDAALRGTLYYQWAILDPPANPLSVVTSKGTQVDF